MTSATRGLKSYAQDQALFEQETAGRDPLWLKDTRKSAFARFLYKGFPIQRRGNEAWKYTDVRELAGTQFNFVHSSQPYEQNHIDLSRFALPCPSVHQIVFVNGHYEPHYSTEPASEAALARGTIARHSNSPVVGRIADAAAYGIPILEEHLGRYASAEESAFTALNTAFLHDGAFVVIPENTSITEPIHLLFINAETSDYHVAHPRVLIIGLPGSNATILESYESIDNETSFTNAVTEVVLGAQATMRLYRIQREGDSAYHVATTQVFQQRNSNLARVSIDAGAKLSRHDTRIELAERGAELSLTGLYVCDNQKHADNHTSVEHTVGDTASKQVFKGILGEQSHGVFVGGVRVQAGAIGAEAHQVNKNLLLARSATIDSQPRLEIFTDEVKATHGAAVGQLDDQALFYLQSRGLGEEAAKQLLVRGFTEDVLSQISDDAIRHYMNESLNNRLLF